MKRAMWIIWPAFLVAGALELLVFSVVDPADLDSLSHLMWSRDAYYSIAFFVFWAVVAVASTLTLWLSSSEAPSESQQSAGAELQHHAP